jgi:hypothetical protein
VYLYIEPCPCVYRPRYVSIQSLLSGSVIMPIQWGIGVDPAEHWSKPMAGRIQGGPDKTKVSPVTDQHLCLLAICSER